MASSATTNGHGAAGGMSFAQQLMEKHTSTDGHPHNVTLEETVDEEDIQHPPPSAHGVNGNDDGPILSEKAAGKQPEATPAPKAPTQAPLDTQSEELFPSLGAPKSKAAPSATWSKKPAVVSMGGGVNGFANGAAARANLASGTSTPMSGVMTPTANAMVSGVGLPKMNLPGRWTEQVSFAPSQLLPRNQLKKPMPEVLRDINRRSKAEVKMSTGPNNHIIFEGTGPVEAVRQALKDVAKELGSKVSGSRLLS